MAVRKSVGIQLPPGNRFSGSVWYIFLPSNVDRSQYIQNCFRTNTVTIINKNNEILHNVRIGKIAIQFIEFPIDQKHLGSPVLVQNVLPFNYPMIVEVYDFSDEVSYLEEKAFNIQRKSDNGIVQISGKSKKGQLFINVNSDLEEGGELYINVANKNQTGKIRINVKGDIQLDSSGNLTVNNQKKINFNSKTTIEHNTGKEPMVLGDTLTKLLEDLIGEIAKSTTAQGPLLNASQIAAYIQQVKNIKSEKSKLE